jgi:SanA protein
MRLAPLLKRSAILLLAFAVALPLASWVIVEWQADSRIFSSPDNLAPAKAGLVLGTSRLLPGRYLNPYFSNRIDAAARLFASGKVEYLIVSGNQSQGGRPTGGYDEPTDMRDALIAAGVPGDKIYRDYAGFRTLDSVLRANSVFGQERVIVVSQHFHLARALFLAWGHGLTFDGLEAADVSLRYDIHTKARELAARVRAVMDAALGSGARFGGVRIVLGVDRPT